MTTYRSFPRDGEYGALLDRLLGPRFVMTSTSSPCWPGGRIPERVAFDEPDVQLRAEKLAIVARHIMSAEDRRALPRNVVIDAIIQRFRDKISEFCSVEDADEVVRRDISPRQTHPRL